MSGLAGVNPDGNEEKRRENDPAKGNYPPGTMLKSLPHMLFI